MIDAGKVTLNTLNHDAATEQLHFGFQGSQGTASVSLVGTVPLVMPAEGDVRQIAKEVVRQLLQEAIEALDL